MTSRVRNPAAMDAAAGSSDLVVEPSRLVVVAQEDLRFSPFLTVVPLGSTLRFVNRDAYDHHVRSTPSGPLGAVAPAQRSGDVQRARPWLQSPQQRGRSAR